MVIDDLNRNCGEGTRRAQEIRHPLLHGGGLHVVRFARASKKHLDKAVKDAGLEDQVEVRGVGCMKLCCQGPLVQSMRMRRRVSEAGALPESHAGRRGVARRHAQRRQDQGAARRLRTHPFFTEADCPSCWPTAAIVDPERIESYIAADGYQALHDVLREMTPKDVVEAMVKSGLRGRGGAGYPDRPQVGARSPRPHSPQKYVICNADEGDPGAFMDRSVLESDPHSVLEGMAIAAYAVGANQGFIYVRAEYPLAISRLQTAIKQAKQHGLAGQRHL